MSFGYERFELRRLAETKYEDARLLLDHDRHASAYYLAGYAVEIGLKACVARQIRKEDRGRQPFFGTLDIGARVVPGGPLQVRRCHLRQGNDRGGGQSRSGSAPMDSDLLVGPNVEAAQRLVRLLDRAGVRPRAALWVYNTEREGWRLWVVPPSDIADRLEFYRKISEVVASHRDELVGFDVSDVEFAAESHPAIVGLSEMVRIDGLANARYSNNVLNGYYLPDAIVIRMAV